MRLTTKQIKDYIKDKSVIILGSAPSVVENTDLFINSFQIIVRLNNYKIFNDSTRTDIYYSYFGRNIKKTKNDLIKDKIKYIMCKYPVSNWGKRIDGLQDDWSWVYEYRKGYFVIPYYIPTDKDFKSNFDLLDRVPTTGVSAILDILRFKPKYMHVTGFDFFQSGKHNINEKWDNSGNHNLEGERKLIKKLHTENKINVDNNIKRILYA